MTEKIDLSKAKTCELVEELKKREGVTTKIAENNQQFSVLVDGPAIVFVVID